MLNDDEEVDVHANPKREMIKTSVRCPVCTKDRNGVVMILRCSSMRGGLELQAVFEMAMNQCVVWCLIRRRSVDELLWAQEWWYVGLMTPLSDPIGVMPTEILLLPKTVAVSISSTRNWWWWSIAVISSNWIRDAVPYENFCLKIDPPLSVSFFSGIPERWKMKNLQNSSCSP